MKVISSFSILVLLAGCATQPEIVTTEHHGKVTTVHHRRRVSGGVVDRIEAIDAKGLVTQAEIHVFDVGRLPTGNGGMHEAHRFYQVVQDAYPTSRLPQKVSSGPRDIFTPPTYVPPPQDQRINDAVTEARAAKQKLEDAAADVQRRIAADNNLRGELQTEIDKNQTMTDQLSAAMNTPKKEGATDAGKAAESELQKWGHNQ